MALCYAIIVGAGLAGLLIALGLILWALRSELGGLDLLGFLDMPEREPVQWPRYEDAPPTDRSTLGGLE
jgi:hypothetical protein